MADFSLDPNKPIVIDGVEYHPDEVYSRNLLVFGVEPTDYEDYRYVNIIAMHTNRKPDAGGQAQAQYRYNNLEDLAKFHQHQYPYYLSTKMVTATDRKGNQIQVVIFADFANAKEMQIVERTRKPVAPAPQATPKPA